MALGLCEKCKGPLCVSGPEVKCEACGQAVPDHPILGAAPTRLPPQDFAVKLEDNAGALPDRVKRLEGRADDLARRLAALEQRSRK